MFVRIPLWRRLVLDFCLLGLFTSHFQFQSLWLVCSYFVFLSGWDVDDCTFLRTCPFFLGCSFCWHIIVYSSLLWSFISLFSVVTSPFSFMILLISALLLFYVMWLAKGCQFCFPFQRAGFWFHWSFLLFSSAVRPHWPLKPNALGTPCPVARTPSCGAWEETRNSHSCVRASAIYYFPVCESPTAVIGCNCIMKASILPCCCGFFFYLWI